MGDWVQFADYQAPDEFLIGHPDGLEYFCNEHLEWMLQERGRSHVHVYGSC